MFPGVDVLTLPRRWTWPGAFSIEQHEVRGDDWVVLSLRQGGARAFDWRPAAAPGWTRWWFVSDGHAWVDGVPLAPRQWHEVPFGRTCLTSHRGVSWMTAARRELRLHEIARLRPDVPGELEALLRAVAPVAGETPDDDTRSVAAMVAALTSRLDTSPTSTELSDALQLDERRTSEAAARYFSRFHATVGGWRDYLRWLRLELALSAFSAGRSTQDVARWLGFRSPNALLHSMKKAGLPAPGALRDAEADPEPERALNRLLRR